MAEKKAIHKNIRRLRRERNLTHRQVSDELGIKQTTYSAYEEGRATPPVEMLKKMVGFYGVEYKEILE